MPEVNADPDKLRQFATALSQAAQQLESIARQLQRGLDATGWQDSERQRFEQDFEQTVPTLAQFTDRLRSQYVPQLQKKAAALDSSGSNCRARSPDSRRGPRRHRPRADPVAAEAAAVLAQAMVVAEVAHAGAEGETTRGRNACARCEPSSRAVQGGLTAGAGPRAQIGRELADAEQSPTQHAGRPVAWTDVAASGRPPSGATRGRSRPA